MSAVPAGGTSGIPAAYAQRITAGLSPGQAREVLTDAEQATEQIMLATRLASGCPVTELSAGRPRGRPAGGR